MAMKNLRRMMKITCWLLTLLCACPQLRTNAQEPQPPLVEATLYLVVWDKNKNVIANAGQSEASATLRLGIRQADGITEIPNETNTLHRIDYKGFSNLDILQRIKTPGGPPIWELFARGTLRESVDGYFVFLHYQALEKNRKPSSIPTIPIKRETTGLIAINWSPVNLYLANEHGKLPIKPYGYSILDLSKTKGSAFRILAAIKPKDEFMLVYRRVWPFNSRSNGIVVFFPTSKNLKHWNSAFYSIPLQSGPPKTN